MSAAKQYSDGQGGCISKGDRGRRPNVIEDKTMKSKQLRPGLRPALRARGGAGGRRLPIILIAAIALLAVFAVQAGLDSSDSAVGDEFFDGGLKYKVTSESPREAEVAPHTYAGAVTIPSSATYGGQVYSVTAIGASAFADCTALLSVTIPSTVKTIENRAFSGCEALATDMKVYFAHPRSTVGDGEPTRTQAG